jgi:FkbM family methyltransferase
MDSPMGGTADHLGLAAYARRHLRLLMPRGVRRHRIWCGPLRGRRLVTSWHDYPGAILGYTERTLLRWLAGRVGRGETWIDIGAHYGYTALALCELVGPQGRVFAFEPVLATAGHLSRTRALNGLSQLAVVPLALAACREPRLVDVPLVRGMAEHGAAAATAPTERVMEIALDEVWPSLSAGNPKIHGVKIDVQGMEIEVLTGMQQALTDSRPVIVLEIHAGVDRNLLLHVLSTLGYARPAEPIDLERPGARLRDDRSYYFLPQ